MASPAHSAIVQQFFRGRSDRRPITNRAARRGEPYYVTNGSVGDCLNEKRTPGEALPVLEDCRAPHEEETVGFVRAPVGMTFQELIKDSGAEALDLCMKEFAAAYENDRHNLQAWWGLGDDWRAGFRYVMWTVLRTDGRKLPGGTVQRAM